MYKMMDASARLLSAPASRLRCLKAKAVNRIRLLIRQVFSLSRYSILSLVALLLGFGRELAVSSHFGLSKELDVYVAMTGFYLFFGVQVANTLEMVFISKSAKLESPQQVAAQLFKALKVLLLINLAVVLALYVWGGQLITLFFPGFSDNQAQLGSQLLKMMLVAIVVASVCGVFKASLNILRIFSPGLLSGAIISVTSAGSVMLYANEYGIDALVYGFIVGNVSVLFIMVVVLILKVGLNDLMKGFLTTPSSDGIWKAAGIVFIGEICYQGFNMAERSFASNLPAGTISAFYYAWTLVAVPLSLVVMPLSTVAYPRLAKTFSENPRQGYRLLNQYGLPLFFFSLIIVSGVSWASDWIVKLIFMRGNFSLADSEKTAEILSILIFSLPFSSFGRMARYGLYSLSSYTGSSVSQFLTLISIFILAPILMPNFGVIGLAYACASAISIQSIVMLFILRMMVNKLD